MVSIAMPEVGGGGSSLGIPWPASIPVKPSDCKFHCICMVIQFLSLSGQK